MDFKNRNIFIVFLLLNFSLLGNAQEEAFDKVDLSTAINNNNPEKVAAILAQNVKLIQTKHVVEAIEQNSPDIAALLMKKAPHGHVYISSGTVDLALAEKNPKLTKAIIPKHPIDLRQKHLRAAIDQKSAEQLELLLFDFKTYYEDRLQHYKSVQYLLTQVDQNIASLTEEEKKVYLEMFVSFLKAGFGPTKNEMWDGVEYSAMGRLLNEKESSVFYQELLSEVLKSSNTVTQKYPDTKRSFSLPVENTRLIPDCRNPKKAQIFLRFFREERVLKKGEDKPIERVYQNPVQFDSVQECEEQHNFLNSQKSGNFLLEVSKGVARVRMEKILDEINVVKSRVPIKTELNEFQHRD